MLLLPLIQLPRGWGTVSNHPDPVCFLTVMMTHNTRPIQGNGCSKDITVDPCISKTKGPACLGFKVFCCCKPISSCPSPPHCFHVCCLTRGAGWRDMKRRRETQQEKGEKWGEKRKNAAALGKVPHHTGCPADTTNSPACVCWGEGLLKDGPLIPDAASSSRLDPPSPPLNRSLIITSRLCHTAVVNKSTHILPVSGCLVQSDKSALNKRDQAKVLWNMWSVP